MENLIIDLKIIDPNRRAEAAEILGTINDRRIVEPLIEALKDIDRG